MKWISIKSHFPRDEMGRSSTVIVLIKEVKTWGYNKGETIINTTYTPTLGYHYARMIQYSSGGSCSGPKNGWRHNSDLVYFEDEEQCEGCTREITHWMYWEDLPLPEGCRDGQETKWE